MGWIEASAILFGGLVAIMGLGLPVAFAFLALNILVASLYLGAKWFGTEGSWWPQ